MFGYRQSIAATGIVLQQQQKRRSQAGVAARTEARLRGISPDQVVAEYVAQTPLGRLELPEDVADVVTFLCSDQARFMTGQGVNVTGGVYMT